MRKSWLKSDSVCLAMGEAVALNLMFESQKDHELFFEYWKKYLGKMATLINYQLTPTGWLLLFKTKSKEEIISAYRAFRKNSKKAKTACTKTDASKILSEHFRIFLSQYVRRTNARHRRKGTKVLESFRKYILNEQSDYEFLFRKIANNMRHQVQKLKKYQADESEYDIDGAMKKDSVWKVGTRLYRGFERRFKERYKVELLSPNSAVLRKYLNRPNSSTYNPPSP